MTNLIEEREKTHGPWPRTAAVAQNMKQLITYELAQSNTMLVPGQREALEMIATKIARIISGDPQHLDSWVDIKWYAELGARSCVRAREP